MHDVVSKDSIHISFNLNGRCLNCRLTEELESAIARVEIAKCTLQALILGSGVDWAQDPELQETLFLCGDTLKL